MWSDHYTRERIAYMLEKHLQHLCAVGDKKLLCHTCWEAYVFYGDILLLRWGGGIMEEQAFTLGFHDAFTSSHSASPAGTKKTVLWHTYSVVWLREMSLASWLLLLKSQHVLVCTLHVCARKRQGRLRDCFVSKDVDVKPRWAADHSC